MKSVKYIFLSIIILLVSGLVFIYSGVYSVSAGSHHHKITYWLLETLREQSISSASKNIQVPELNDPKLLLSGGADYNEMCSQCHLKPGKNNSDMSLGLYPEPPNLTVGNDVSAQANLDENARRNFWIIKYGIKATGMPAWGITHDDGRIWAMVAFLQKLPELNEIQYQIITARDIKNESHH